MTKTCTKCGESKDLDQFSDTVILTKRGDCKTCEGEYTRAYYFANKQKIRENERLRRRRKKEL